MTEKMLKDVLIAVPASGINLGTVSLRKSSFKNIVYIFLFVCCLSILSTNFHTGISLQFQYFEVRELSDLELIGQFRTLKRTFKERRERLDEACLKYSNPLKAEEKEISKVEIDPTRFYYLKNPNFLMCMIPKVASTSFSRFLLTNHQNIQPRGMDNLGYTSSSFAKSVSNETYKVMVVRHPMERLLSAYIYIFNDEVLGDISRTNIYSNLTRLLLGNYRESSGPEAILSFPEFVRYLVNGTVEKLKGSWITTEDQPGDFWIRDEMLNAHWTPYWKICTPCNPETKPYAIIKLGSNVKDEVNYVFQESGVYEYFKANGISPSDLDLPLDNPSREGRSEQLRWKYFSMLTKNDVKQLYSKYRADHELFGYTIEPYLSLAQ